MASACTDQFRVQEVKGRGHMRPKLYLETWRRHHSRFIGSYSDGIP